MLIHEEVIEYLTSLATYKTRVLAGALRYLLLCVLFFLKLICQSYEFSVTLIILYLQIL